MEKKDNKNKGTDFQGAVSLEAIFAATQANKDLEGKTGKLPIAEKKEEKKEVVKEAIKEAVDDNLPIVEKKAAVEPIKKEVLPVVNTEGGTEAFKTAKRLLDLGLLEDFSIQISDDDEEGVAISAYTDMTEENLQEIIKIDKQEKQKEISSKYIPKGNIKEHQLKVFEILSNGGDLSQIAETPEKALERPFEGFDMENQQRQVDVRYTDLVNGKGLDHDSAITIIDKEVKSGKIKDKAIETFELYRAAHAKYIDDTLIAQKKDKEFKDLNFKENKKVLVAKLKESGLKESVYKKVASEYAKKNENGESILVDKLKEALKNPEENHELILHLADKQLFNEAFKIQSSHESIKTIVRLATGSATKGNKQPVKNKTTDTQAPWLKIAEMHNENLKTK